VSADVDELDAALCDQAADEPHGGVEAFGRCLDRQELFGRPRVGGFPGHCCGSWSV
jgi:hypothetical protein